MKRINEFGLNAVTAGELTTLSGPRKAVLKMAIFCTRQDMHDSNAGSRSGIVLPERFLFPVIWLFSKYGRYLQQECTLPASPFLSSKTGERIFSMVWVPVFHVLASIQWKYARRKQMTIRVLQAHFSNSCMPNSSKEFSCQADSSTARTSLFPHESKNPDCRTDVHFPGNPSLSGHTFG